MRFLASSLIWFVAFLPAMLASYPVVAILLLTQWDGRTTWFGNWKYGHGDSHYGAPSRGRYWKQWWFLCVRNPVSNFGKQVLSVKDANWVWLYDVKVFKQLHWKYGWKDPVVENGNLRTFVFRPWLHD